jgi:hypothetical protein
LFSQAKKPTPGRLYDLLPVGLADMFIAMNHGVGTSARYFDGSIPNFFIRETSVVRFMVSGVRHIVTAEAIRARRFNRIVTSVLPPQPVYATGMPKARKVFSIWNH